MVVWLTGKCHRMAVENAMNMIANLPLMEACAHLSRRVDILSPARSDSYRAIPLGQYKNIFLNRRRPYTSHASQFIKAIEE